MHGLINRLKKILKKVLDPGAYNRLRKWYHKIKISSLKSKFKRFVNQKVLISCTYPLIYWFYSRGAVKENKIVFIEPTLLTFSDNYRQIYKRLDISCDVRIHLLKRTVLSPKDYVKHCITLIKDVANAKYIFLDDALNVFGRIHFRAESKIVQVWHACGAFKRFGFGTADKIFGGTREELEKYPYYRYCTHVFVSSPEVVWAYSESMNVPEERIFPTGTSRTDVFYDEEIATSTRKRIELLVPQAKDKKIILFAPTFRGRVAKAATAAAFSIPLFYEALSEEYILILKHHPYVKKIPAIPQQYREFAFDLTNLVSIEELLYVADICISDYSSLIFEYSLFERPMLFFAYDLEDYYDWRGFYYPYKELTPGPVFRTNLEMIDYIQHIDERFDRQKVIDFRNKFMSGCDGKATDRLLNIVFGDDQEKLIRAGDQPVLDTDNGESSSILLETGDIETIDAEEVMARIERKFPAVSGKKIISYFITSSSEFKYPSMRAHADWNMIYEYLSKDHVILYHHPARIAKGKLPPTYYKRFYFDCTGLLKAKELAGIADVVITDYSFNLLSRVSLDRKVMFFIPDFKRYCRDEEDYGTRTEYLRDGGHFPGDTKELITAIQSGKGYVEDREEFLSRYWNICRARQSNS